MKEWESSQNKNKNKNLYNAQHHEEIQLNLYLVCRLCFTYVCVLKNLPCGRNFFMIMWQWSVNGFVLIHSQSNWNKKNRKAEFWCRLYCGLLKLNVYELFFRVSLIYQIKYRILKRFNQKLSQTIDWTIFSPWFKSIYEYVRGCNYVLSQFFYSWIKLSLA